MKEKNKMIAWLILIMISMSLLLSCNFMIKNAHHKCLRENCPICIQLDKAMQMISNFGYTPIILFEIGIIYRWIKRDFKLELLFKKKKTLISLKVELLN